MGFFTKAEDEKKIIAEEHHSHKDIDQHHLHDNPDDPDYPSGPLTCRDKLRELLHTQKFQVVVIILVVLDCILVIGELILDYEALAEVGISDY